MTPCTHERWLLERDYNRFGELFFCRGCQQVVTITVPELLARAKEKFDALEGKDAGHGPGEPARGEGTRVWAAGEEATAVGRDE